MPERLAPDVAALIRASPADLIIRRFSRVRFYGNYAISIDVLAG
jgi:hypothetical protein